MVEAYLMSHEEEVTEAKVDELKTLVIGNKDEVPPEKPSWQAPKAEKDPVEAALLAEIESK